MTDDSRGLTCAQMVELLAYLQRQITSGHSFAAHRSTVRHIVGTAHAAVDWGGREWHTAQFEGIGNALVSLARDTEILSIRAEDGPTIYRAKGIPDDVARTGVAPPQVPRESLVDWAD